MYIMLDIIFENNDFVIIHKPVGISFHNDEKVEVGLFNQVKEQLGGELYAVHRLDKVTSGLILFAKNQDAASIFGELFREHDIQKFYLAIAGNKTKKKQGMIKGDMEKGRRGAWKLTNSFDNPALTQFFSYSLIPGLRLYVLRPLTGKTHQLRVALKSLGVPILGDTAYAADASDRVYLHAYMLSFNFKGKEYRFTSLPKKGDLFFSNDFLKSMGEIGDVAKLKWPKAH